jgi:hypothetical protein
VGKGAEQALVEPDGLFRAKPIQQGALIGLQLFDKFKPGYFPSRFQPEKISSKISGGNG